MRTIFPSVNAQAPGVWRYFIFKLYFKKSKFTGHECLCCNALVQIHPFRHIRTCSLQPQACYLWPLSNQRSNALLKDSLLLKEAQTLTANHFWIFLLYWKSRQTNKKKQRPVCHGNFAHFSGVYSTPRPPTKYARFTAAWLLHLTLNAKVKPPLALLPAFCHLKYIGRFGKTLITSQHMVNSACMWASAGVKYLACDTCTYTKKAHTCLTSTQKPTPGDLQPSAWLVFNLKGGTGEGGEKE